MYYGSIEHIEMRRREAEMIRREHAGHERKSRKRELPKGETLEQFKERLRLQLTLAGKKRGRPA